MTKIIFIKSLHTYCFLREIDIEKFPDELYKQIDIKLFKHKAK